MTAAADHTTTRRRAHPVHRHRARHRGIGLPELMIAVTIAATMLVAVAVSTEASFQAYKVNATEADLTQRTRVAFHRMVTDLRRGQTHAACTPAQSTAMKGGQTVTDSGIAVFTDNGDLVTYAYDAVKKELVAKVDPVGAPPEKSYTLLRNVESFQVTLEPMQSTDGRYQNVWDLVKRATLLVTVRAGTGVGPGADPNQTVTLSTSVMPRQNTM